MDEKEKKQTNRKIIILTIVLLGILGTHIFVNQIPLF